MAGKLRLIGDALVLHCPACKVYHSLSTKHFDFDGSWEYPTINQDIISGNDDERCHFVLRNGCLEYLPDCTHAMANMTVALMPFGVH